MFSYSLLLAALPLAQATDTVLGVYMFHRHGDRTSKSTPPANLTSLGYQEVFESGTYFRNQYVASGAASQIAGVSPDIVNLNQISVSAPLDNVLMSSATGFLQGFYPPVGLTNFQETLHNGTNVSNPLNGYQIIPIQQITTGTGSEDSAWLQGSSNCANAIISSNNYFSAAEYVSLENSTQGFYNGIIPMVNNTFNSSQISFKNAYLSLIHLQSIPSPVLLPFHPSLFDILMHPSPFALSHVPSPLCLPLTAFQLSLPRTDQSPVYDLLNVASTTNTTFPSQSLLTPSTAFQLRTLADTHEYNLAYNVSDPIRAIAGSTLAAQILQALNTTITTRGTKQKLTAQFGAYGSFQSFFGLANLTSVNADFYGIPDYASNMVFELYTTGPADPWPADAADLRVRFLFHNGTTSGASPPVVYPLFGSGQQNLSWAEFGAGMGKFAVGDQGSWCEACGNTTGVCAPAGSSAGVGGNGGDAGASGATAGGNGLSPAVNGVVGAMVTLAVILGLEALVLLVGGYRLVSKKRLGPQGQGMGIGSGQAVKA